MDSKEALMNENNREKHKRWLVELFTDRSGERDYYLGDEDKKVIIEALQQPERPKGRWIEEWRIELDTYSGEYWEERYYKCSLCGRFECVKENFCPNCGAEMVRGEEE